MTERIHQLIVTDKANPNAQRVIREGISQYNREMAGYVDTRNLSVLVLDSDSGRVIGGLLGRTSFGLLFIDLLFLPKALRGDEIGTRIIEPSRSRGEKPRMLCCRALHDHLSGTGVL
jgi:hypothetical protein